MRGLIPKTPKRLPQVLYRQEADSLVQQPKASSNEERAKPLLLRDTALLELLYGSGLRLSEVAGLNLVDIDVRNRTVRVVGKGNKERMVPLSRPSIEALNNYAEQADPT